jgi:hypothetical protein
MYRSQAVLIMHVQIIYQNKKRKRLKLMHEEKDYLNSLFLHYFKIDKVFNKKYGTKGFQPRSTCHQYSSKQYTSVSIAMLLAIALHEVSAPNLHTKLILSTIQASSRVQLTTFHSSLRPTANSV